MTETVDIQITALSSRSRSAVSSIWDNLVQPEARPGEVPWHGDGVTADWLTAVFATQYPEAKATDVARIGGDNGSSARRIIEVVWNAAGQAAGLPVRLFTKSTPALAMRLSAGRAAPAEGQFLLQLRPHVDIEAPRCLFSERDANSGRSMHLMHDLAQTRGAEFCRAHSVIDLEQAQQVIDTIATLHGTFLDGVTGHDTSFLRTYESFFHATVRNRLEAMHGAAMERARDVIPPGVSAKRAHIWRMAEATLALHSQSARSVGHREGSTRPFKQTGQPVHARTREDRYLVQTSSSSTRCGATGVQRPSSIALRIHAIAVRLPRTGRSGVRRHLAGT